MENLLVQVLVYSVLGSIVGGIMVRVAYRTARGVSVFKVSDNLCDNCDLRFRLIELVPVFGSLITAMKVRKYKYHLAKEAFWFEVIFVVATPVIFLTSPYMITSLIIFTLLCAYAFHYVREMDNIALETREARFELMKEYNMVTQVRSK